MDSLEPVDVYICSETLEHLEDPDAVLRKIRGKSGHLVLTTPDSEATNENPEHYWSWGTGDLESMLHAAGWTGSVELFTPDIDYYTFQIWTCS